MSKLVSLDPRVTRLNIDADAELSPKTDLDQFQTFEVFHQQKSGARHIHVGSLHAPTPEIALVLAKEQYGRRGATYNMWVVSTNDVLTMRSDDADIFETTPDKKYRDVSAYMMRSKIDAFKKAQSEGETK